MKHFYLLLLCTLCFAVSYAQPGKKKEQSNLQFGFKAGAVYTQVSDLSKVLVSESYYSNYTFKNKFAWGATAGVFINYKFDESISGIYSEMAYSRVGNELQYSDINNFNYSFILHYEYLTWEIFYKAYVLKGLFIGVGPRMGFNLTPTGILYTSNGESTYGSDIRIQQQMRDVLKGRANFSLGVSLGYELINGLSFDARYYYGISDIMETEVNNFHFIENKNTSQVIQVTIGYALPYSMRFH